MLYRCISRTSRSIAAMGVKTLAALFVIIASHTSLAQLPSQDFFPIGVYSQPMSSFDKWKSRGINSLFQYEAQNNSQGQATVSMQQWSQTAAQRGLYYARHPSANPANDLQEKYLMAWTQLDEPDLENHNPNPAALRDIYQNLKAISPSKPVWVNFAGNHITPQGANYKEWAKGGDWLSMDWYPFNANPTRYTNNLIGQALDKLRADSQGVPKKLFAIIESSNQKLNTMSRAPTTDEFRGAIWEAIVHGATGIIYFPQQIGGGFQYDVTPANLVSEMQAQNAKIKSFARILNSTRNPSSRSFSPANTKIEGTWRTMSEGDFFFVYNNSSGVIDDVSLVLGGVNPNYKLLEVVGENRVVQYVNGQVVDDFTPYGVHIYRAAPGITGASVPEPGVIGMLLGASFMVPRRRRIN